ncbi:MAG: amino acid racemase [Candidatus Zixiibacteriota bacterium]
MVKQNRPRLGIIGGMGSVAAAYFFKRLIELTPAKTDQEYVETFVHNNTQIPDRTAGILYGQPSPLPELRRSVEILNRMGADYIVLACMTSHYFIPQLQEHSQATILDGIAHTAERCRDLGLKRVGVIASTGAIKLGLFQKQLLQRDIEALVLRDKDQEFYFTEPIYAPWGIKAGNVTGQPKERLRQGAQILIESGAEAIVAGCSELPLVFKPEEFPVPLVDTIDILLETAIRKCLQPDAPSRLTPGR